MPGLATYGFGVGNLVTLGLGAGGVPILANAFDLITSDFATKAMAAAGYPLSDAQQAILPTLITAASKEIQRFCNRLFVLLPFDEIVTPEGGRQDRGEPASAKLTYYPVQSLSQVYTGRATSLLIQNTDQTNNQYATVQFAFTGDVDYFDLQYTGLQFNRINSGSLVPTNLAFASYPTIQHMADAINALGHGWQATVQGSGASPNIGQFPSAGLVGVREPKSAFSPGVGLDLFAQAATSYDIDRSTGIMRCYGWNGFGAGWGGGWGDPFGASWDGLGDWGGGQLGWSQYWVSYEAGYKTVPEPIQIVCATLLKNLFQRWALNPYVQSETLAGAEHSITFRQELMLLTPDLLQILTTYKDFSV